MLAQTTRYTAPEVIIGASAASSDWWSLGVIILEMVTNGECFEGVHEKAFLLHLVTRGIRVPGNLPQEWRELLMGLLARDPSRRWRWAEVERWLNGERGIPHGYDVASASSGAGPTFELAGTTYSSPEAFALAAADEAAWDIAKNCFLKGAIAT